MSEPLNLTDLIYCESTRNVDNMIAQFEKDRYKVIDLIENNIDELINTIWTSKGPVGFDDKCLFNMGNTLKEKSLEDRIERNIIINEAVVNYHSCPQCKNMKRIFDSAKNQVGNPFYIECGNYAGSQLVITESKINHISIIKESPPPAVTRALSNPYINTSFLKCNNNNNKIVNYVGSDPFTNNLLINWYLEKKLTTMHIPNIIKMHIGFICGYKGYNLYEYPDIGRIRHLQEYPEYLKQEYKPSPTAKGEDKVPFSKDVTRGIIMQLFATLHSLRPYDFSHGGPSSRSILLKKENCSYLYDGVHVEGPATIKLCDFQHAGITVGNTRFYNKSTVSEEELLRSTFKPIIEIKNLDGSDNNSLIYRINDPTKDIQGSILFMYVKHLGLPIYQSSFDAYGFMISLMADHSFYSSVMKDEAAYNLWKGMWLPEEYEKIHNKMKLLHRSPDPATRVDKVMKVLAGFGLKCNMIESGWNMIKRW
jgi:hypothetical protein